MGLYVWYISFEGAKVTCGTLPILAPAFAEGKPTMVVVVVLVVHYCALWLAADISEVPYSGIC